MRGRAIEHIVWLENNFLLGTGHVDQAPGEGHREGKDCEAGEISMKITEEVNLKDG